MFHRSNCCARFKPEILYLGAISESWHEKTATPFSRFSQNFLFPPMQYIKIISHGSRVSARVPLHKFIDSSDSISHLIWFCFSTPIYNKMDRRVGCNHKAPRSIMGVRLVYSKELLGLSHRSFRKPFPSDFNVRIISNPESDLTKRRKGQERISVSAWPRGRCASFRVTITVSGV